MKNRLLLFVLFFGVINPVLAQPDPNRNWAQISFRNQTVDIRQEIEIEYRQNNAKPYYKVTFENVDAEDGNDLNSSFSFVWERGTPFKKLSDFTEFRYGDTYRVYVAAGLTDDPDGDFTDSYITPNQFVVGHMSEYLLCDQHNSLPIDHLALTEEENSAEIAGFYRFEYRPRKASLDIEVLEMEAGREKAKSTITLPGIQNGLITQYNIVIYAKRYENDAWVQAARVRSCTMGFRACFGDLDVTWETTPNHCNAKDGTITLFPVGGTPPYSYKFNGTRTTESVITGVGNGSNHLVVYDSRGCDVVYSPQVGKEDAPRTGATMAPTMVTLTADAEGPGIQYAWFRHDGLPVGNTRSITVLANQSAYIVEVTTPDGDCSSTTCISLPSLHRDQVTECEVEP